MTTDIVLNEETVEILCRAIAIQAANDYRIAIAQGDEIQKRALHRFFRSKWGNSVCFGAGEYIARTIEAEEPGHVTTYGNGPKKRSRTHYKHTEILGGQYGGLGRPYTDDAPRVKQVPIKEAFI